MIDQLVELKLLSRREDARDRRTKRVAITDKGRALLETIEQRRVDVQLKMIEEYLSQEECAIVLQAMMLLARAGE